MNPISTTKKDSATHQFIKISDILDGKYTGKDVKLHGWAYRARDQKDLVFIMLRDSSGIIQLACKGIKDAASVTIESSIEIEGIVKEDKRAPGGFEIGVSQLKIIGLAERFPITKDLSEEFLREQRHLWLRGKRMTSLMKIRAEVFRAFRQFHYDRGYIEFHAPIFTPSEAEGGSTLFEVKYGDKEGVYLTQTWQLYAEAAIFSLERIFTIAPTFRAEKSRTKRHLSEFWMAEMEAAWMDHEQLMEFEEDMIIYIIDYVIKTCKGELEYLERDIDELKKIKKPFMKMPYDEALEILGKPKGYDLTDKDERELLDKVGKGPIHLTQFPRDMKAFYMKVDPKDPKKVKASDLLMPGMGEIIGGSERISDPKELEESLKIFKLKKEDYGWYMDLRKYGTVPHSGFGLGVERLVVWLAGIEHIMDAIAFPRTMDRVTP